jgi:hypothetical protein
MEEEEEEWRREGRKSRVVESRWRRRGGSGLEIAPRIITNHFASHQILSQVHYYTTSPTTS